MSSNQVTQTLNRRKILAVSTKLKKLRKESLKNMLTLRTYCEDLSSILLLNLSPAVQIYDVSYIQIHFNSNLAEK